MTVTITYLFIWLLAFAGALLVALASHWAHAEFMAFPDKLFDGGRTSDTILNEMLSPEHRVLGQYDEAGWWEFYSWRNYAIHAVPCVLAVLVIGLLNWDVQAEAIAALCNGAAEIGLSPRFCP